MPGGAFHPQAFDTSAFSPEAFSTQEDAPGALRGSFSSTFTSTPADLVLLDNAPAARRLAEHLIAQGCRRIALLAGSRSSTGRERQAGYEAAMRDAGLQPQVVALRPLAAEGQAAAAALLAQTERPDALLATNGLLLLGAWKAVREAGLAMPEDVAIAGFDNNDWTTLPEPAVTVMAQPTADIGRTAAELLLQRMAEPGRPPRRIVLEGELLVRGSSVLRPSATVTPPRPAHPAASAA